MVLRHALILAVALAALSGAALAEPQRSPEAGGPALQIDVPSDWSLQRGANGELVAMAPDRSGAVMIVVFSGQGPIPSLDSLAADMAKGENAQLQPGSQPGVIDGHKGQVFTALTTSTDRAPNKTRSVIAVLDPSHVAVVSEILSGSASPEQLQAVDAIASKAVVVGTR